MGDESTALRHAAEELLGSMGQDTQESPHASPSTLPVGANADEVAELDDDFLPAAASSGYPRIDTTEQAEPPAATTCADSGKSHTATASDRRCRSNAKTDCRDDGANCDGARSGGRAAARRVRAQCRTAANERG